MHTAGMNAPADIAVRQAVLADLDGLAELFDQYRQFQGQAADRAAARAFLQARLDHGESVLFLCEQAGRALGFAQLYPMFSSVALQRVFVLNDLFVAPAGRRRGVATQLLVAVEAYAFALGAVRVSLNVVRDNRDAQALYAARGWQPDSHYIALHRYAKPER